MCLISEQDAKNQEAQPCTSDNEPPKKKGKITSGCVSYPQTIGHVCM